MAHNNILLEEHPFEHEMIDADSIRFYAVAGGTEEPLLLIAGFPQTWYGWRRMMPLLAENTKSSRLTCPVKGFQTNQ